METKYDDNNIFAKILRGEIPCSKVFENECALAFHDISPESPVHVLVVPKINCVSFNDFAKTATPEFMFAFFKTVQNVAETLDLPENGYRIITNHGAYASQSVPHFHVHILGGRNLGRLLP